MGDNESYIDIEFGCPICGGINLDCNCVAEFHKQSAVDLNRYRIRRSDPNNIVIEKFGGKLWRVISYHGNSHSSLLSGLFNVIMAEEHTPTGSNLPQQLEKLRLELISSADEVEKMIKEADLGN